MIKRIFGGLILLVSLTLPVFGAEESPKTIKVLLLDKVSQARLKMAGGFLVFDPATQTYITRGVIGKDFLLEPLRSGLKWGEEYVGIYQITVTPKAEGSIAYLNNQPYRGAFHIYQVGDLISVVNEVSIEDYVKSVLATRLKTRRPSEVCSALAIATRTHALYLAQRGKNSFWHVRADVEGYTGTVAVVNNPLINRAVEESKFMVLELGGQTNQYFPAVWTENCAGKTASYNTLFRKATEQCLRGVESPYAVAARELNSWRVCVPQEELAQLCGVPAITEMELFADPWSCKVYAVRVSDGTHSQTKDFFALQEFIGKDRLRSAEFTVCLEKGNIVFTGYGEGHGVGLCLYSAEQLAQRGKSAADILTVFYPDAILRRDAPLQKVAIRRPGPMQPRSN